MEGVTGNVSRGEEGCDLVAALRFGSPVTRKRADRGIRRRKMRSSPAASASDGFPSSALGFSSLTVASSQHIALYPVSAADTLPPPLPSSSKPPVICLTPIYDVDRTKLRLLFQKILKNSDVNDLKRIIIPKKAAEAHLPVLQTRAIQLTVYDVHGHRKWTFKYRYWPNNASRMYVFENAGEFVAAHDLRAGDTIIMYIDTETQNLVIEAKKFGAPQTASEPEFKQSTDTESETAVPPSDIFPKIHALDVSSNQLFYDTSFCNESPLDFLGGSAYYQYPCPLQNDFIDNISSDDFHF